MNAPNTSPLEVFIDEQVATKLQVFADEVPDIERPQVDTWPDPLEIKEELPPAPRFDSEALLPPVLGDFVQDIAHGMPCPPDFVAATLLVSLGAVIGARCAIKPKQNSNWIVTSNLYGGVIGDPSTKKSPAIGEVMRQLDKLESNAQATNEQALKNYAVDLEVYEAQEFAIKKRMKGAASSNSEVDMSNHREDMHRLEKPTEPVAKRFKSNDSTTEMLGELILKNPNGLLVYRDELVGLLSSWDKEGRESDKAFYLEAWNGTGSFNIDRIGRGSLAIKNLCLSVFGGIQPDLLERYLHNISHSFDNDGRIQRFQVLVYPDPVAWEWRDVLRNERLHKLVADLYERLANCDPLVMGACPSDESVKLPYFNFDAQAQEVFIEWCIELNRQTIANESNTLLKQHFGKYEKLFCSIALILHLVEGRVGPVQVDTALKSAAWCEFLSEHARRIYAMAETAKVNLAKTLSRKLLDNKLSDNFTLRDVIKKNWSGLGTFQSVDAAINILEANGWVEGYESSNSVGRPTTRYVINPKVLSKMKGTV